MINILWKFYFGGKYTLDSCQMLSTEYVGLATRKHRLVYTDTIASIGSLTVNLFEYMFISLCDDWNDIFLNQSLWWLRKWNKGNTCGQIHTQFGIHIYDWHVKYVFSFSFKCHLNQIFEYIHDPWKRGKLCKTFMCHKMAFRFSKWISHNFRSWHSIPYIHLSSIHATHLNSPILFTFHCSRNSDWCISVAI